MTLHGMKKLLALALVAGLTGCIHTDEAVPTPQQEKLHVAYDVVGDGVFSAGIEGPASGPDGALYAVSFGHDGTIGRVTFDPDGTGRADLFMTLPEGSTGNGIRFDADGFMYVADYTGHHILRIDPRDRSVGVFATLPGAHQPNDIAFAPNGMFYASDPDWRTGTGQLWRILPYGRASLLETGMGTTNGVEVGPKGDVLYVNESVQRRVWAYDLDGSGEISGKRLLVAFPDHGLDGMRTDVRGNLYIARYGAGTVAVVSPQGEVLREVKLKGQKPTNVAFGGPDGRTVFVTLQDRGAIEAFRADYPGRETGL
ncbi:SMP-30/gluconolactonase/LRE family protein [Pseudoxanthomonas sp. SE1]|uniref:SMP-30/gluconolactonase/LRE family protein n=1 Tax=Pseudoxanthomonas sp. SE1 TaxID=1664560 RepID=UPI00240DE650|nr:SMP-30/gluconolactonase/LRE family protein [Pseudoxanthomonas sp. SE1]WFC41132.1 SMP-30/gluconolactonase/LRE family protein [Pseudoxanthomonas sp. SE1]